MTALFLKSQLYLGGGYSQAGWDAELHLSYFPLAGQKSSVLPCADATEVFIFSYYIYIYIHIIMLLGG